MAGQAVGQGSHSSPPSFTLLPQVAVQSESLVLLHPVGQQSSPPRHWACTRSFTHWALQVPGLASLRSWHPMAGQVVGQGSHSSPRSLARFPQVAMQSESLVSLQAVGQHPSPARHSVCRRSFTQRALQLPAFSSFIS